MHNNFVTASPTPRVLITNRDLMTLIEKGTNPKFAFLELFTQELLLIHTHTHTHTCIHIYLCQLGSRTTMSIRRKEFITGIDTSVEGARKVLKTNLLNILGIHE